MIAINFVSIVFMAKVHNANLLGDFDKRGLSAGAEDQPENHDNEEDKNSSEDACQNWSGYLSRQRLNTGEHASYVK